MSRQSNPIPLSLRFISFVAAAAALPSIPVVGTAWADDVVPGHVIVAATLDHALLLWDATPEIASIVVAKLSDADANVRLEHDALHLLAASLSKVKHARTITLRVLYSKTGELNPVYGTPTFAGIERYASVEMSSADASRDRDQWQELAPKAAAPAWVQYRVIGRLPR